MNGAGPFIPVCLCAGSVVWHSAVTKSYSAGLSLVGRTLGLLRFYAKGLSLQGVAFGPVAQNAQGDVGIVTGKRLHARFQERAVDLRIRAFPGKRLK